MGEPSFSGKVLIVDDEKDARFIVSEHLTALGFDIDEAEDGDVALEKVKQNTYSLVITDLRMSRMNGDILLDEVKKLGFDTVKFVIMSGASLSEYTDERIDKLAEEADGFIEKPFTKADLEEVIREALS